ncbi:C4-dicarboxylate transporter, DctQ subunit [Ensifer adhaerens]|nr:C4-dicarboxylate transporter, DctQ subunit [Ensifer adhaerens]
MLRLLDRLEEILIATLIAAATVIIFVSVTHRYALSGLASLITYARVHDFTMLFSIAKSSYFGLKAINLIWAQELCIIMFVWMAKFGAAYGVRTGIHVGIDVVINRLSPERRFVFILFGLCAGAFFTGTLAVLGANFVWHMYNVSSISPDLELPMWIVYLAVPLGSGLMCFRFLQVAYSYLRTGELPHHDHGHVDGMDEVEDAIADSPLTPKDR